MDDPRRQGGFARRDHRPDAPRSRFELDRADPALLKCGPDSIQDLVGRVTLGTDRTDRDGVPADGLRRHGTEACVCHAGLYDALRSVVTECHKFQRYPMTLGQRGSLGLQHGNAGRREGRKK